eukprot:TRINITY_DN5096_c0_g2_i1.p1 TRINITY_DN5096_c0_g2~~TRINITY_DN5096_c0_g2_i1.p1  ORF type:complete len:135 (-),score=2.51 TRINITY_DN5096_c0_g2_i1:36-440(-)
MEEDEFTNIQKLPYSPAPTRKSENARSKGTLATFIKKWGAIGITTHMLIALISFLCWYKAVSSGLDVQRLMTTMYTKTGWNFLKTDAASAGSKFATAYVIYKTTAPLRWPLTLLLTPLVGKLLGVKPKSEDDQA